jgi:energy-coupling factor transporter ATP-binding protein EcfA2
MNSSNEEALDPDPALPVHPADPLPAFPRTSSLADAVKPLADQSLTPSSTQAVTPEEARQGEEGPVLRTLAPNLRQLEAALRAWLNLPHQYPYSAATRATLENLANDIRRQADALDADRPLLVIMLMGGTGVGKSTLLNALAGGAIAQASYARPTTRDPVVYFHESVKPDQLDPVLQHCRLSQHDRPALEQKIIVDTPDLDSNDLANREKLLALLPVADIVLYVGSQEKYHDKLGWELFLQQRRRRAFAFVLNKWDRCLHPGASGLRPDDDLLRDLKAEGFRHPLLFRTNAQHWVDRSSGNLGLAEEVPPAAIPLGPGWEEKEDGPAAANGPIMAAVPRMAAAVALPEGEQFKELTHWLEMGLSRLEVEAIKARGVGQLLQQLQKTLEAACPPDLSAVAQRTQDCWGRILGDEAAASAAILLNTLEPYQREIEHHFALERQGRFRGLMANYLQFFNRMKYAGSSLRDRLPFLPKSTTKVATPAAWDLSTFTRACSGAAADRSLDARSKALANRLLVEASQLGFPLNLLSEPTEATATIDWRQRHAQALVEVLGQVEHEWARPTGWRSWVQGTIVLMADWLPLLTLGGVAGVLLWGYTVQDPPRRFEWGDLFLLVAAVLMVLIILHVVIALFLPLRWPAIRGEFQRQLETRLHTDLEQAFSLVPQEVAQTMKTERQEVERLLGEVDKVSTWLAQREQAASIAAMYGN